MISLRKRYDGGAYVKAVDNDGLRRLRDGESESFADENKDKTARLQDTTGRSVGGPVFSCQGACGRRLEVIVLGHACNWLEVGRRIARRGVTFLGRPDCASMIDFSSVLRARLTWPVAP